MSAAYKTTFRETGWRRFRRRLQVLKFSSRLFNRYLTAAPFNTFNCDYDTVWRGDPDRGNAIFQGIFDFADHRVQKPNEQPWALAPENSAWMAELHGFGWLHDIAAVEADAAKLLAQRMILSWIGEVRAYDDVIWDSEVAAHRVIAWLRHGNYLLDGLESRHRDKFTASLAGQYQFLKSTFKASGDGRPKFLVAAALLLSCLAIPGDEKYLKRARDQFIKELAAQSVTEGKFADRTPSSLFLFARRLISLNHDLKERDPDISAKLSEMIEQVLAVLQILRHSDGSLAVFGTGEAISGDRLEQTIERSGAAYQQAGSASSCGFQRLAVAQAVALVDAGLPAESAEDNSLRPGLLSLEFSVGSGRLIVNGAHPVGDAALAGNSCFLVAGKGAADFQRAHSKNGRADRIKCRRHEDDADSVWLETVHGGFQESYGVLHQRRFFLDGDGSSLRGEDVLLRANDKFREQVDCAARFFLHPDVQASKVQGGGSIMLRLPAGGGWQFRADGGEIELCDSVYIAEGGPGKRTQHILVKSKTSASGTKVRWVFLRL